MPAAHLPDGAIWALSIVSGYLLGSIPFGLVITKLAGLGDIRAIGSGNIGATNVLRTGRKDLALATLLLDAGKAGLAYWLCWWLSGLLVSSNGHALTLGSRHSLGLVAGAMAFVGHCYPVWLKFKGGKGVATFVGLLFAAAWPVGIVWGATWLAVAFLARMSSLAALVACVVGPVFAYAFDPNAFEWSAAIIPGYMSGPHSDTWIVTAALAVLIFWRHRANITRLLNGTEPKIGAKKDAPPETPG
ncbi:MAG: glycerol-3-phosphate 1-O-acyltransferase PlsY [Alphaproteobacteria bacterium]|nr:glycerol-3-phosphate 1-O-acyltransferase PlsY [Alphaproteobacteria bacterium]